MDQKGPTLLTGVLKRFSQDLDYKLELGVIGDHANDWLFQFA